MEIGANHDQKSHSQEATITLLDCMQMVPRSRTPDLLRRHLQGNEDIMIS